MKYALIIILTRLVIIAAIITICIVGSVKCAKHFKESGGIKTEINNIWEGEK